MKFSAFMSKGWKMVFTWEDFFERGFRALIMVLSTSGLAFADQVSEIIGEPSWAKKIRIASLVGTGLSLLIAAGQRNPSPDQIRAIVVDKPPQPPGAESAPPADQGVAK
jgi:hypothetical protein